MQRLFAPRAGREPLACEVTPLPPALNFAFRFIAGYTFHLPPAAYQGTTPEWSVLAAITPESGGTTYFVGRTLLSEALRTGAGFDVRGLYFLGEGRYSVEATIRDNRSRVCRKQWQVVVEPSRIDRMVPLAMPPNSVGVFSPSIPPDAPLHDQAAPIRLSILLNAAAFSTRRTTIQAFDRAVLLGALTTLLEHLPASSVRLVVFSLEQQREVFRSDHVTPADVDKAAAAILALQQATVDVHVLEKPQGHIEFLAGLLGRERAAPDPADTIVFLGATSRYGDKIPENALPAPSEAGPRFFYVRYESLRRATPTPDIPGVFPTDVGANPGKSGAAPETPGTAASQNGSTARLPTTPGKGGSGRANVYAPPPSDGPVGQNDIIASAVSRLKGKTLTVHNPADLANAIRKIEGKR